jgi:serine protease Do
MTIRTAFVPAVVGLWLAVAAPLAKAQDIDDLQEQALKAAAARVAPSIVQIETTGGTEIISAGPRGMQVRKGVGPTTGLIVAQDGYVISSAFNFANKPSAIFVTVPGHKERYVARIVANDLTRMLTLLKIEANGLPVPTAAPKKDVKIGQWAIALGRTLQEERTLSGPPSISIGVVSALNRIWGKAIQTDAKVSPVNYGGPMVNILGQVMGILVPASPREEGATAGHEWYDSGIGFAIYMEDINGALPRLREGRDLRRGLLGVTMQGQDQFGTPPTVATIAPDSAAEKAGIKPGDVIVEIDGHAIASQAQLLHRLGGKYEGDVVTVVVKRGNETVKFENLKLAGTLTSYPHPFLGIVPLRDDPDPGEEIRYVYPDSPAAKAGLKAGDRIMKIGTGTGQPQAFNGRNQLSDKLNALQPGTEVKLEVQRKADKKTETITAKLIALPDTVPPDKLPELATMKRALEQPKAPKADPKDKVKGKNKDKEEPKEEKKEEAKKDGEKKAETGFLKRSNQARDHDYWLYIPSSYDPNIAHALLVWLHPVGKNKEKDFEDFALVWKEFCEENSIILLMPKGDNENGWLPSESDAIVGMIGEVGGQYTLDRQRIVAHGMGIGGQMAYYLGFQARDLIRGVATTGAVMTAQLKDNVPTQRLQFFMVAGGKDPLSKDIQESQGKLLGNKFSVVYREIPEMGHQYLDAKTLTELARWVDSLDRQ